MSKPKTIKIPLFVGRTNEIEGWTTIDEADYDLVKDRRWHLAKPSKSVTSPYYAITSKRQDGKQIWTRMHRLILGLPDRSDGREADHINGDGLDNRRSNLRVVTPIQNKRNIHKSKKPSTSKYLGVCWNKQSSGWAASYGDSFAGIYETEKDAAVAVRTVRRIVKKFLDAQEAPTQ